MIKRQLLATTLATALVVTATSGLALAQEEAVIYPAEGVVWQLDGYGRDGALVEVPADVEVTLFLSGGDVVGTAGCNSYFGSYVIDATTLSFPVPFGSTRMLCEGAAQEVENTYLPLLSAVTGWSIDEEGVLSLSDAAGSVTLLYSKPTVVITAADIEALGNELASLQAQIDQAEAEIAALIEAAEAANIDTLRRRVRANEQSIAEIDATIDTLRRRVRANEQSIAEIDATIGRFRNRINRLEDTVADHEARLAALEQVAVPLPAPAD
jgi:heat shock protein HslJ/prefoldin subunit 5